MCVCVCVCVCVCACVCVYARPRGCQAVDRDAKKKAKARKKKGKKGSDAPPFVLMDAQRTFDEEGTKFHFKATDDATADAPAPTNPVRFIRTCIPTY